LIFSSTDRIIFSTPPGGPVILQTFRAQQINIMGATGVIFKIGLCGDSCLSVPYLAKTEGHSKTNLTLRNARFTLLFLEPMGFSLPTKSQSSVVSDVNRILGNVH